MGNDVTGNTLLENVRKPHFSVNNRGEMEADDGNVDSKAVKSSKHAIDEDVRVKCDFK